MKKAIYTIMIGSDPSYKYTARTLQAYANKVGAEFIKTTSLHYKMDKKFCRYKRRFSAWFEKIYIHELLKQYDRVLYIDADILITPDAPDLFELYPEEDKVYMLNEGAFLNRDKPINQITSLLPLQKEWPVKDGKHIYYNSGVILLSKQSDFFAHIDQEELQKICTHVSFYEQTYFNYLMIKHEFTGETLTKEFNRMDFFGHEDYLKGYFIHYAGGGYCKNLKLRYRTIIEDYQKLCNDPSSSFLKYLVRRKADVQFIFDEINKGLFKIIYKIYHINIGFKKMLCNFKRFF